ncbi:6-phosphogluconolactonase [Pedobacter cryotolerans]|uniref:Glucosamine-6-phosphate deaminase n=1 Tax=Pedobacter cryotolerans TaxID=2571270 RepID=A0A4V5NYB2_9SPHI|nr:6-phosphogluconolactonase [Pedobacter cryotolerans]TKC01523.1 glucosamine-6-phosphate deaminase [Pedobacter cryotolerans]
MREFIKDKLTVKIFENRKLMGEAVAGAVSNQINELLSTQPFVNIIFGAAPSQNDFFESLLKKDIDWARLNAFHMDEYVNLAADAPQGFGNFLKERLFDLAPFNTINYIDGNVADYKAECLRYTALLNEFETDIVCLGIGENTHLAFNDPHVADENDPFLVKRVDLDEACRTQQVNDGCFATINEVPTHALTLTLPALLKAPFAFCTVPTEKKAQAVYLTINEEISDNFPSTLLRKHKNAVLFLDNLSSVQLSN